MCSVKIALFCLLCLSLFLPNTSLSQHQQPEPNKKPTLGGPWNNDLVIQKSTDGIHFDAPSLFEERGGVATMSKLEDEKGKTYLIALFQWFPFDNKNSFDKVAVKFSYDLGKSWTKPKTINVLNMPENLQRPFDPTLVSVSHSQVRLYFTSKPMKHDADRILNQGEPPRIYSAISSDGLNYSFEQGERFWVKGQMIIDCAVGKWGDTWHLYSPIQGQEGSAYHATSKDGLNFTRQKDIYNAEVQNWLGNIIPDKDGLRFYTTGFEALALSKDGFNWTVTETKGINVADPGLVKVSDGLYYLIGTGPRRSENTNPPPFFL